MSGPTLKEKALEIAKELDCATFKASNFYRELIMKRLLSNIDTSTSPEILEKSIPTLDARA
jgi:hypothetical protein